MFPLLAQLQFGAQAAQRRFTLNLAATQRAQADEYLNRMKELLSGQQEAAEAIADLQTEAMKALADAVRISNEASAEYQDFIKEQSAQEQAALEQARKELSRIGASLNKLKKSFEGDVQRVAKWFACRAQSAGGNTKTAADLPGRGFPIPTGTIIWTLNDRPPGWLYCNGATLFVSRFPQLYEVIGNRWGGEEGTTFVLPSRSDCPGYSAALSDAWRAIIRT